MMRFWIPFYLATLPCILLASEHEPAPRPLSQTELIQREAQKSYRTLTVHAEQGTKWFGSEDARYGYTIAFSVVRPEPRFAFVGRPAQAVWSVYYMNTRGSGFANQPERSMDTVGATIGARYPLGLVLRNEMFLEAGWGLSYSSQNTIDLDSKVNSTPYLGAGFFFNTAGQQWIIGVRWWHMSNAGFRGQNLGMNNMQYTLGIRF